MIHSTSDGDEKNIISFPWLLTEKQNKNVKYVIEKTKIPTRICSNIKNILANKGELGGVKTLDWHTFIKVTTSVYIFVHW